MEPQYQPVSTDEVVQPVRRRQRHLSEISCSLPVQILLYHNVMLSVVFFVFEGGLVVNKLQNYIYTSNLQRLILVPIFVIWVLVEPLRLYFGFLGNLQEMVPQMTAFLLMTLVPQSMCTLFLTCFQEHVFAADVVLGGINLSWLGLELLLGRIGLKAITAKRTGQFYRVAQRSLSRGGHREHQD